MEEFPGGGVSLELPRVLLFEFGAALFIRINAQSIFFSQPVGFQSGRLHSFLFDKFLGVANVDVTPDAAGFARRESDHVTVFIDALANAVNPSEAQSFIDRLGPGDARFA